MKKIKPYQPFSAFRNFFIYPVFIVVLSLSFSCKSTAPAPEPDIPSVPAQLPEEVIEKEISPPGVIESTDPQPEDLPEEESEEPPLEEFVDEDLSLEDVREEETEEELVEEEIPSEPLPQVTEPPEIPSQEEAPVPQTPPPAPQIPAPLPPVPQTPPPAPQIPEPPPVVPELPAPLPPPPQMPPPAPQIPVPPPAVPELPSPLPPPPVQVPEEIYPRQAPPSPPPFLRPAEPETPAPLPLERPLPLPINPLPELPSRTPYEAADNPLVFSRVARVTVGQMLEIPFRGTGWIYLGELGNRRGISYDSRRLDVERGTTVGQSFVFRADVPGAYILKFYKQDFLQDYIINDYVQVIVGERGAVSGVISPERVIAEPRWPLSSDPVSPPAVTAAPPSVPAIESPASPPAAAAVPSPAPVIEPAVPSAVSPTVPASPPAAATVPPAVSPALPASPPAAANVPPAVSSTVPDSPLVPPAAPVIPAVIPVEEYLRQARQEYNAGRIEQALNILNNMRQFYPNGIDEAWWLYGQLLEANSSARDIRQALDYYRRLVTEFPQSNWVEDARRRIAYLERYYLNIR